MAKPEINEVVAAWQSYLNTVDDWQVLVEGVQPKVGGCGKVYELPNPIDRPNESFAVADMRDMDFSEPHKHSNGETEIYFIIEGVGKVGVGNQIQEARPGTVIVTSPDTVHCTYSPGQDIILAVINTPPFNPDNYVTLNETDAAIARRLLTLQD